MPGETHRAPYIRLILVAIFVSSFGGSIFGTVFTNYLDNVQHFSAGERGLLELPRELPGILSLFAVSGLFFLGETGIAAFSMALMGIGTAALAFPSISSGMGLLIFWIMAGSLGQHILMGVTDAIVIHTALPENRGLRLGQMRALCTAAGLGGALFVWVKWKFDTDFGVDFLVSGGLCLVAAALLLFAKSGKFPVRGSWKEHFVFKKRYVKYYLLETLFGARKQVFMTFAFWLMVSTLSLSTAFIGKTMLIAGVLGLGFQPFIGKMIQVFGEAKVLVVDSVILFGVCVVYAYATETLPPSWAVAAITVCFILDNMLFADGAARANYIGRICERKEDITPSLYTGLAINHAVSIVCAMIGGWIWTLTGSPKEVFLFSGFLAILSGAVSWTIPKEGSKGSGPGATESPEEPPCPV